MSGVFCFFKQKTAYEMRISDWISDVCSSDLTPQYKALQALYSRYKGQGLVVVGFPANDFAGQEPGTNEEISSFCSTNYGVNFPMFSKLVATGEGRHPLYSALIEAQPKATPADEDMREKLKGYGITPTPEPEVLWNFEKFLVGRNGNIVARFAPNMAPDDPRIVSANEIGRAHV